RRSGPLGPCRLRQCAGARPRRRPVDGRIERRAGLDVAAARRRPRHPAAPLDADERALGFGPAALRLDARRNGLGGGGAAFARPAGKVPRPYGPASASEGEDRLEREEAMSAVRHHLVAAAAAVVLHAPDALAAQGQPLAVTLGDAIRRALDVQPAMVQARGTARNAGAGERSAWGAFLPTVNTSASASRSNQTTLATQQAFFTALADEELVRVAQAQVQRARQQLQISVNKFQAGAATRSDTLTSTVELGSAQLALLQAQANLATAQAALGRQIGVDQLVRAVPDTTLPLLPDTTAVRASALETAPVVTQAEAAGRAASAQVWSARAQYWPSVTVSYSTNRTGVGSPDLPLFSNYPETFAWRFGLSWTLFNGFQREQSQVSASVARDVAAAQAADARRQVNAQLTQQVAALFTAYAQIGIAAANVVAATEALRVQQERYRVGAGTQLDEIT